jgi:hypothetical protein
VLTKSGTNNYHGSVGVQSAVGLYGEYTYANDAANAAFRATISLEPVTCAVFRRGVDTPRGGSFLQLE